jgi:iron(III) transport system substrate-binding protein
MTVNPPKVRAFKISLGYHLFFFFTIFTGVCTGAEGPKQSWQAEWEKTVEAAKKEGQVNIYPAHNQATIIDAGVFQKRFPEIKVTQVVLQGAPQVQRILSERRAGKYLADVVIGGGIVDRELARAQALDPIKPTLILPEVLDESKWWQGTHHYADAERQYTLLYIGAPASMNVYYNTKIVNPSRDLRSPRDLLNPKWKGRLASYDIRGGGPGGGTFRFIYHHPKLGPEFIRRLFGETDITLTRDGRLAVDWLATGKFPICVVCSYTDVEKAKSQGLPVDTLSFGAIEGIAGLTAEGATVSLANRAPHPNAAKVFINWLLSREGQITAQKALVAYGSQALDTLRIDTPKDEIPANLRRIEGIHYIHLQDPSRLDMGPIFKTIEDALRSGGKR